MVFRHLQLIRGLVVCLLVFTLISPQILRAQSRIVEPSELKNAINRTVTTRQKNLDQVRSFFSNPQVRSTLAKTAIGSERVDRAIASLSDSELQKLAERTSKIQADFAGGAMSNQELTYIVIALAAAVLVLVVVAA